MPRTAEFSITRNDLIRRAYRQLGLPSDALTPEQWRDGLEALQLLLREEDLATASVLDRPLWALEHRAVKLVADQAHYAVADGLAGDIRELIRANYRHTDGTDTPLTIIGAVAEHALSDKTDAGQPEKIYLRVQRDLTCQELWTWPVVETVGTCSEVVGTDGENYVCVNGHTSAASNQPITGTDWRLYWDPQGSAGSTWVTATAYTNGALLTYVYRRALYDFDSPSDDPDIPVGWGRYLTYQLAYDLAPAFSLTLEEQGALRTRAREARAAIFPSTQPATTDHHDRVLFY